MPVRFQVDPDFYDHPKVLGMSDAAFALWVRAGSYSVAKLQDGFVPDDALSLFSQTQQDAAGELVRRGLWKRTRGGYRFHQWDHRNLLRARVESDREQWREQKRRQRGNIVDPQVNGHDVRGGQQGGQEGGHSPDSSRSPDMSVSTSVSVSKKKPPSSAPPKDDDPDFAAFWDAYPRKVGKGQARKAWPKAVKAAEPTAIIAGARRYAQQRYGQEPQYTAHPATWLNGERWTDQPGPAQNGQEPRGWWDN
jgi:hypothetical protein